MPNQNPRVEDARKDLLREASRSRRPIYKLKNGCDVVKVKYKYASPEEVRTAYLEALDSLVNDDLVTRVMANSEIELYQLTEGASAVTTVPVARQTIVQALKEQKRVYKIHSDKGEYLQAGDVSYNRFDDERIAYLEALYYLIHHGEAKLVDETSELSTIELWGNKESSNPPLSNVRWP